MVLAITPRGSHGSATNVANGATFSTGSFTPTGDSLLLAFVATQQTTLASSDGVASVAGHGTWTKWAGGDVLLTTSTQRLQLWWCKVGSSPSASAVTVTNTTTAKIRRAISVIEVTGHDQSAAITDILRQVVISNDISGLTGAVTMGSFLNTDSATIVAVTTTRYQEDYVWDASLTEAHDLPTGTELMRLGTAYVLANDATPGWSWGANSRISGAMGIEVVALAAGGTTYDETGLNTTITTTTMVDDAGQFVDSVSVVADVLATGTEVAIRSESVNLGVTVATESNDSARRAESLAQSITVGTTSSSLVSLVESLSQASVVSATVGDGAVRRESRPATIIIGVTVADTLVGGATVYTEHLTTSIDLTVSSLQAATRIEHLVLQAVASALASDRATRVENPSVTIDVIVSGSDSASTDVSAPAVTYAQWSDGRLTWTDRFEQDRDRDRLSR
jgi:hypothetical protein